MELRLLGAVEIVVDGLVLDAGGPRQRLVLAVLAAEAGRPVGVESLIDRVWDEPPEQPRRALQVYISRIRHLLETANGSGPVRVLRGSGGYRLDLEPDRVDVNRFRRLVSCARSEAGGAGNRLGLLGQALDLWRGPPLMDLPGQWASRFRSAWDQQYLDAAVAWARAALYTADPSVVLPRLAELTGEHPLVEPLAAVFIRALCASGQATQALDHCATVRHQLAEQLGTDPGPELQQLHRQILSADPALTTAAAPTGPSRDVPRQLPAPPQMFTGRAIELADLDEIHDASTVVITAIDGMAGVGKTALAVEAAHQMVDRYPDGQLFIDLHGYTHGVAPTPPGEALDRMLRALEVPGDRIPSDLDERAGLYRSRLADQRMLIVLDNAAAEAQVTPLLPGAPGCMVLVTSRRRLAGLDHTRTLSLDTLPPADAITLLRQTAGESRLAGQPPDLVADLVELCGRLPLAIRIAAARLRSHPTWDLAHLTQRLRDQQHRLVELETGQRSVAAALDLSYQDLRGDQQRTYRLLGLHFGLDIDAYAAAALLDATLPPAGRKVEQLLEAHLLQEPVAGRYRFHDLVRAHAAHTATRDETEDGARRALDRLLDYYRHTAAVAMDAAYPYERELCPRVPPAGTPSPALPDPVAALNWLDSELPNLLAAATYATEHDRPAHLLHLSTILHRYLRTRGRYHDAATLHDHALTTARAAGYRAAELAALLGLGHIHRLEGRHRPATDHLGRALRLARATGHRPGELDALLGLGHIHHMQGQYDQATDRLGQALQLARATGHRPGELEALTSLGLVHRAQGRYQQAIDHLERVLQLARATGDLPGELRALGGLGWVHVRQGRRGQAADYFDQALQLARTTGHRTAEQNTLTGLGNILRMQGRYQQATNHYRRLLDLAHESGDRNYQFEAQQGLGRLQYATGHPDVALTYHDQALALATELGQPADQARARDGLAHAQHALHQPEPARKHWQHALDILTRLGIDHTDDEETSVAAIRTHLAKLNHHEAAAPKE